MIYFSKLITDTTNQLIRQEFHHVDDVRTTNTHGDMKLLKSQKYN